MPTTDISNRRAATHRLSGSLALVGATTLAGTLGVVAAYYPLRHAPFGVQWLLVFVLMTLESAAVHLPSEVILPVGGWLVVREHHLGVAGVIALSAIAAAGNTIGSSALYAAGRIGGRPLVRRWGRWFLVHERDIDAAAARMSDHGSRAVFVSRLLPVVRTYAGFVAGLLDIPLRPFVIATFAGPFVWCLAFVAAGALLGSNWRALRAPAEAAGVIVMVAIVVAVLIATMMQQRSESSAGGGSE